MSKIKKRTLILFTAHIIIILCFIFKNEIIVKRGEEYKINVELYDPYDPFRGSYLRLKTIDTLVPATSIGESSKKLFVTVEKSNAGYMNFISVSDLKPIDKAYLKVNSKDINVHSNDFFYIDLNVNKFFINEKFSKDAENAFRDKKHFENAYLLAKLRNGNIIIEDLYINGVQVYEYLMNIHE